MPSPRESKPARSTALTVEGLEKGATLLWVSHLIAVRSAQGHCEGTGSSTSYSYDNRYAAPVKQPPAHPRIVAARCRKPLRALFDRAAWARPAQPLGHLLSAVTAVGVRGLQPTRGQARPPDGALGCAP